MKNIWLSPYGRSTNIEIGRIYRACIAIFDSNPELYDQKAEASIKAGRILDLEEYLLSIGYARIMHDVLILPPNGLNDVQVTYLKACAESFSDKQVKLLAEVGVEMTKEGAGTSDYYGSILNGLSDKYKQPILDTYGNSHDFNRDYYNITYAINKLRKIEGEADGEEKTKDIKFAAWNICGSLIRFAILAEGDIKPTRLHERLIKMNYWDRQGKLYGYQKVKRDNIKRMLGMEVANEVGMGNN